MASELSGRPLRDTRRDRVLFVDREQPLRAAETTLRNGGNVLLVGSRGSGKSSLVRMIAHQLSEEDRRPAAVVDGRAAGSTSEFVALLRDQLGARLANGPQIALRPSSGETQALLSQLRELGRTLPTEGKSVVLVDEMPSPESAHTLFGRLRDELWELPLVWLVAVDERDVGLYREPPADAFWQRVVPIPKLDADSATELLRRRLDPNQLPDAVLAQLVEAAGDNPRRLIALTYDVVVEGADPSSVIQRNQTVQQQISDVSEPARRLLAEVEANGAASPSDQALLTKLGWTRSRASQVFRELEQHGLVRPLERPGPRGRPRRLYEATY
jgi:energy-coupling factor transporter ATP-binding protein EcfA2